MHKANFHPISLMNDIKVRMLYLLGWFLFCSFALPFFLMVASGCMSAYGLLFDFIFPCWMNFGRCRYCCLWYLLPYLALGCRAVMNMGCFSANKTYPNLFQKLVGSLCLWSNELLVLVRVIAPWERVKTCRCTPNLNLNLTIISLSCAHFCFMCLS